MSPSRAERFADALVEPIVSAVSSCMRPEWTGLGLKWIEAFDQIPLTAILETVRDLFGEHDLLDHYCVALRRKIAAILEPVQTKPQVKVKPAPKAPRAETRIPAIERKIALGLQLLDLKSKAIGNIEFSRLRRKLGVEPVRVQEALRVAGLYGKRPEIYRCLTWLALVELSSPSLPADARAEFESKIVAGSRFTHTQIRARRPLKKQARRMAA